jgi:hypothetical protein
VAKLNEGNLRPVWIDRVATGSHTKARADLLRSSRNEFSTVDVLLAVSADLQVVGELHR